MLLRVSIKLFLYTLFIIFCGTAIGRADKDTSLVARFAFINGSLKGLPSKLSAKLVGASLTNDRFGNKNSAYYLQGNYGSYINLGTSSLLKPLRGTVSVWFKMDNLVLSGQGAKFNPIILTKSQPGDDFFEGYCMSYDVNSKKIGIATTFSELNQVSLRSIDTLVFGKWYNVAITYDDDFLCLYVNGLLENKMAKKFTSRFLATDSVMVGNSANHKNDRFFNGTIDDIEIYNRALTPEEVLRLYNADNPNKVVFYTEVIAKILFVIILIFAIIWLSIRRFKKLNSRKQEKIELANRLMELETKAIRTQMNPHFIFNSLNTLHRFILEADLEHAETYLTKFSKLLRRLMESSSADKILLAEEIEILNGYLEIEKLRFANSFDFKVECSVEDAGKIYIPFMLVQPFVENAIWHGLIPNKNERIVRINFSKADENRILCIVDDNGVGREASLLRRDPLKKKSLAMDFIKQRLELISKSTGIECNFKITDKKDGELKSLGTKIEIVIPILK